MQKKLADDVCVCVKRQQLILVYKINEPMENCVAPGLDKFQSIIKSCIVFGQSIYLSISPHGIHQHGALLIRKPHKLEFSFRFVTAFCHVFFTLC